MGERRWTRVAAVEDPERALADAQGGTPWVFVWCGTGNPKTRSWEATEGEKKEALQYARRELVDAQERERLMRRAARKGRSRTVVQVERWVDQQGEALLLFWEGGPHVLPERDDPEAVGR